MSLRYGLLVALLACRAGVDDGPTDESVATDDGGATVDSGEANDSGSESDSGSGSDTGTEQAVVRFIALGDGGEGNDAQHIVADMAAEVCAQRGCDFALYLGDNIYDSGVDSIHDPQFDTKFEIPYQPLDFPFYVVLGNHDLGGDGLGLDLDPDKALYEINYSKYSDKWDMEAAYYTICLLYTSDAADE